MRRCDPHTHLLGLAELQLEAASCPVIHLEVSLELCSDEMMYAPYATSSACFILTARASVDFHRLRHVNLYCRSLVLLFPGVV